MNFFVIFFTIYGSMNVYFFLRARAVFPFGIASTIITCLFVAVMTFAPWLVRVSERAGLENFTLIFAYISFTWMGVILIFFVTGVCTDLFRLLVYVTEILLGKNFSAIISAPRAYFFICLCSSVFVVIYGSFEARNIKTEHIVIESRKIPAEVGTLRIAQISDVHLGMIVGENRLKSIIAEVQKAKPDILVSTGDLLDGQPDKVEVYIDQIKDIYTPHGKYAVTGNHEVYFDRFHRRGLSKEMTENAGFRMLDTISPVYVRPGLITLVGVDDEAGSGYKSGNDTREESLCSRIDKSQFTVLLKHRPVPYTGNACTYDLQLSGHTHKGQIFPFFLLTRLYFKYYGGLYPLNNGAFLYVNRGSGTWGPPIRFLAPPEVTVIDIVHKEN